MFQFTLPRGERLKGKRSTSSQQTVSIHAPARGATGVPVRTIMQVKSFQFTLPRGERLITEFRWKNTCGFNSRSREGSDRTPTMEARKAMVSIHAPARGATQ